MRKAATKAVAVKVKADSLRNRLLANIKCPRNLKHVRQPTPSRMSYLKARVLEELKNVPQPMRSRVSYLKVRALDQIQSHQPQLKHIKQPKQANQQRQMLHYLQITHEQA